eukprot:5918729-Lingulodinium_polyedra.AAC.1
MNWQNIIDLVDGGDGVDGGGSDGGAVGVVLMMTGAMTLATTLTAFPSFSANNRGTFGSLHSCSLRCQACSTTLARLDHSNATTARLASTTLA